ncbi:hypothetical protein IV505_16120 [Pseudomonas fulva]|nr:DUF6508 domain-containing protein [Pseudomonas fulva]MBF8781241.1 hypothetical protein [Pseudomonas fulva]
MWQGRWWVMTRRRVRAWLGSEPATMGCPVSTESADETAVQVADMDELIAFLPRLYPDGVAIEACRYEHGAHWPTYPAVVDAFYDCLAKPCWSDPDYRANGAGALLDSPACIAQANLAQMRSMLTWCVRGERFCDGHWAAMIDSGRVLHLLRRLVVLRDLAAGASDVTAAR